MCMRVGAHMMHSQMCLRCVAHGMTRFEVNVLAGARRSRMFTKTKLCYERARTYVAKYVHGSNNFEMGKRKLLVIALCILYC